MKQENTFDYQGIKMYYVTAGSGKPLLLLNGVGMSNFSAKDKVNFLSKKFAVISPDLPGFGKSDMPTGLWDFESYAIYLKAFIQSLNLENLTVVGESFSGPIAIHLANQCPQITRLILINPAGLPLNGPYWKTVFNVLFKKSFNNLIYYRDPEKLLISIGDIISNIFIKNLDFLRLVEIVKNCVSIGINLPQPIQTPSLILSSTRDELFPSADTEKFKTYISSLEIEYLDEYHDWFLFRPELIEQYL